MAVLPPPFPPHRRNGTGSPRVRRSLGCQGRVAKKASEGDIPGLREVPVPMPESCWGRVIGGFKCVERPLGSFEGEGKYAEVYRVYILHYSTVRTVRDLVC